MFLTVSDFKGVKDHKGLIHGGDVNVCINRSCENIPGFGCKAAIDSAHNKVNVLSVTVPTWYRNPTAFLFSAKTAHSRDFSTLM